MASVMIEITAAAIKILSIRSSRVPQKISKKDLSLRLLCVFLP